MAGDVAQWRKRLPEKDSWQMKTTQLACKASIYFKKRRTSPYSSYLSKAFHSRFWKQSTLSTLVVTLPKSDLSQLFSRHCKQKVLEAQVSQGWSMSDWLAKKAWAQRSQLRVWVSVCLHPGAHTAWDTVWSNAPNWVNYWTLLHIRRISQLCPIILAY